MKKNKSWVERLAVTLVVALAVMFVVSAKVTQEGGENPYTLLVEASSEGVVSEGKS